MAGIYIHIPFCKVKCHYCDFHFSTKKDGIEEMTEAIIQELIIRKDYLVQESISTIYFGGGTPSLIGSNQVEKILNRIHQSYKVEDQVEVTLECNPDDLTTEHLKDLRDIGVNRLSVGVQSFDEKVLKFMNRAHSSIEAISCLENIRNVGFENVTMDLIYGIPDTNLTYWKNQLEIFDKFEIPHLSAYCLTIENNTVFGNWQKKGRLKAMSDTEAIHQFDYLMDWMESHHYNQYEISNFCKEGFISKHNSSYWKGVNYLGIGPSAHSFDGKSRQWNVAHNINYIKGINEGKLRSKKELLTDQDKFNEYILTRLRTKWGLKIEDLNKIIPQNNLLLDLNKEIVDGNIKCEDKKYLLTKKGKHIADAISASLFI